MWFSRRMTVRLASLRGSTLRDGPAENAQCGCAVWNPADGGTVLPAVVVAARCPAVRSRDAWAQQTGRSAALQASVHSTVAVLLWGQTTLLLSGSPPTILLLLGRWQITPRVPELTVTPCTAGAGCPWYSRTDWPFLVCRAAESLLMLQLDISAWCWSWLVLDRYSSWRRRWLNESRLELWPLFIQTLRCSTYPAIG